MITILTPSKTMNFNDPAPNFALQSPQLFADKAAMLRSKVTSLSVKKIQTLMNVSADLAAKTHDVYRQTVTKQAFWAYDGDVFKGVQAKTLDQQSAEFAQRHVLVPSGLYGLVRPYDMISSYRLEMKAKLEINTYKNLYVFWGSDLGEYVGKQANGEVLMLASMEYAKVILPGLQDTIRVVTPVFIDQKPNGKLEQVAIYNKMMRGVMARWVIDQRIDSLNDIPNFSGHGYSFSIERSTKYRPVFFRSAMKPLVF